MKIIIIDGWDIGRVVLIAIVLLVAFRFLQGFFGWGLDDSDIDSGNRSGLRVHTDAKTGVQYLSTGTGGVTPRLREDGSVVVVKLEK